MVFSINISKRDRKRRTTAGELVVQTRYVLNMVDPKTRRRKQLFFERLKDAQAKRNELLAAVETGTYSSHRKTPSVGEAVRLWLENRRGQIKSRTLAGYEQTARCIVGPLLLGSPRQRHFHTSTGETPDGARIVPLLGPILISELSTAEIRTWHKLLQQEVGHYTANRAKMFLKAALDLAAEDFNLRPPAMPSGLGRGRQRPRKAILTPEQVATLLRAARGDRERGVYYAFPYLTGVRPSEQLGLLWEDVDFEKDSIRICRMQETDGSITNLTKTEAGARDIPIGGMLREWLLEWRLLCPRRGRELYRVFPGPGRLRPWPQPRSGGGGPLLYQNFRVRYWRPAFQAIGLPYVTPHSARHSFISTLQARGIEVGLVAKLAGHANANVTLGHYTQAVRGGEGAIAELERAYA